MRRSRKAGDRGRFDFGGMGMRQSFSFGKYFDPDHHHRALRVLNEDRVQPGQGFETKGDREMEILTWVLEGTLAHPSSLGTQGLIRPGGAQVTSAGTVAQHSEFNYSRAEPASKRPWFGGA